MAKHELLTVDLQVDESKQKGLDLERIFQGLRKRISETTSTMVKAFGVFKKTATQGAQNLYKAFQNASKVLQDNNTAKAISRTVAGFDQLNRLAKKNAGGGSLTPDYQKLLNSLDSAWEKTGQLGQAIKDTVMTPIGQWASGDLADGVDRIKEKFGEFFANIQENFFGIQSYTGAWDQLNLKRISGGICWSAPPRPLLCLTRPCVTVV